MEERLGAFGTGSRWCHDPLAALSSDETLGNRFDAGCLHALSFELARRFDARETPGDQEGPNPAEQIASNESPEHCLGQTLRHLAAIPTQDSLSLRLKQDSSGVDGELSMRMTLRFAKNPGTFDCPIGKIGSTALEGFPQVI
jgi:hypothetical protein